MDATTLAFKAASRALQRDHILRFHNSHVRLALVHATTTANTGIQRHGVSNWKAGRLFGRATCATALLSAFLKGEERCIVQFMGNPDDDITRIYTEAMSLGELRGYISGPGVSLPAPPERPWWNGSMRSAGGSLSVSRILYDTALPVQSITSLQGGDIESDLAEWFRQSEQVDTAVRLDVVTDSKTGKVLYAGGALAQRLAQEGGKEKEADAVGTTFEEVASRLSRALPINSMLDLPGYTDTHAENTMELHMQERHGRGMSLTAMAKELIPELAHAPAPAIELGRSVDAPGNPSPFLRTPLDFHCRCSKERFTVGLARLGASLLDRMKADYARDYPQHIGNAPGAGDPPVTTLTCQFCNNAYDLSMVDIEKARQETNAMSPQRLAQTKDPNTEQPVPEFGRPVMR